jgi:O-antigen/teichoic acid export membrane protein
VIIKLVSSSKKAELPTIFSWFAKKSLILGLLVSSIFLVLTPVASQFLHTDVSNLLLLVPLFFLSVLNIVYKSFLQGLMRFFEAVIASNVEIFGRVILGAAFILLGYSVFGGVLGLVISALVSFFLLRYFLRDFRNNDGDIRFNKTKEMLSFALPMFLSSTSILSLFSTDVILVKHFFSAYDAGIYASLSTLGKIVYFGASPVAAVMFPMVSKRYSKGQGYKKIFYYSLLLTLIIVIGVAVVYRFLPALSMRILYGEKYIEGAVYLFRFSIFMGTLTLSSFMISYFLSKGKVIVSYFAALGAVSQAIGLWFIHNSVATVINVSTVVTSLLLASLLIYFGHETRSTKAKE